MYERQLLRELESLRPDVASSNAKTVSRPNGIPQPTIVPPLEDDFKPPAPSALPSPSLTRGPVPSPSVPPGFVSGRQAPVPPQSPGAGSSKSPIIAPQAPRSPFIVHNSSPVLPTQVRSAEPPLGGRFVDGTKSMFIHPSSSAQPTQTSNAGSPVVAQRSNTDPLLGGPLGPSDPMHRPGTTDVTPRSGSDVDPLGGLRPSYMSASVRVQPTRQRLDAREAASKLANMF